MIDREDDAKLRSIQRQWASRPMRERLKVVRRARYALAEMGAAFASAMPRELTRNSVETRAAELLPLLAAAEFLEQRAEQILKVKRLGKRGLPLWLLGTDSEVRRVPFGTVLVIGPANYPLFVPGVQTLQALATGNAVVWKPGRGGKPVAELFAAAMDEAGLPQMLLRITEDSVGAGVAALHGTVDKVIFTGSAENARTVLRAASDRLIPCVVEASGCDAVVVLPSADVGQVVKALTFGMRLNGSATCMAPRRVLVFGEANELIAGLTKAFESVPKVELASELWQELAVLLDEAEADGAKVIGDIGGVAVRPLLVLHAKPEMEIAKRDVFAPVLSVIGVSTWDEVVAAQETCPFGLTASIFGAESEARRFAERLNVGTVLINDVIVSTIDPRVPFGGRRLSGFGVTQGAEGLLEMTAAKVITAKRSTTTRQYEPTDSAAHVETFDGLIEAMHSRGWVQRLRGLTRILKAASNLRQR